MTSVVNSLTSGATYTYDGSGELEMTAQGGTTSVPTSGTPGGIPGVKRHRARRAVTPYLQQQLAWNTALGGNPDARLRQPDHQLRDAVTAQHTDFIMGPNAEPVEQVVVDTSSRTTTPDWYYGGFQGNTRVLMGKTGSMDGNENENPFGSGFNGGGPALQYSGAYTDRWSGFTFDQARWYDPQTGQFLSQDPMVDSTLQGLCVRGGSAGRRLPTQLVWRRSA